MNLSAIWQILKEIVPLVLALINALKSSEDKPAAAQEIKKTCEGIACSSQPKK